MPTPTPPIPTTPTAPHPHACTCAFALTRPPITSSKKLCHVLSHYPEIAGMVVGFWNGEVRMERDLKALRGEVKTIRGKNNRTARTEDYDDFCYDCAVSGYYIELNTIFQNGIEIFRATPSSHPLTRILEFFSASFRYLLSNWLVHPTHGDCHYERVTIADMLESACASLSDSLSLHPELARSLSPKFAEFFPLEPPFTAENNPEIDYTFALAPLLRFLGCSSVQDILDPDVVTLAYWTIPWETGCTHVHFPGDPAPARDWTVNERISMAEIINGHVEGLDTDWTEEELGDGGGKRGLVVGGHGWGWGT